MSSNMNIKLNLAVRILVSGPRGSGKTQLSEAISEAVRQFANSNGALGSVLSLHIESQVPADPDKATEPSPVRTEQAWNLSVERKLCVTCYAPD